VYHRSIKHPYSTQTQEQKNMKISTNIFVLLNTVSKARASWRSDLPWSDLEEELSFDASLIDTSPADYLAECTEEYEKPPDNYARSNQ
jgi:ligand-binding sensor domain-containing protein